VGISFLLKFEQIGSSMPISTISQWREAYSSYKSLNQFPVEYAGKLSAMNVNMLLLSVLCSRHPMDRNKPHIFAKAAETVFCAI
jgi:hypothetical protein